MELLDRPIVLRLNSGWMALGHSSVRDALVAMNSGDDFVKAAVGVNVDYPQLPDGSWDFENPNLIPTPWSEWVNLPIRDFDDVIHTSKLAIRVPTVIVAVNYEKIPKRVPHPTKQAIRERDGSICQITGRLLTKREGNIDHMTPRSRGGKDTWENLIWIDKELNSKKGDKTLEEMGWKPIRKPFAPKEIPVSATIKKLEHRDWKFFLKLQ